jgi:cell division protein FtsB
METTEKKSTNKTYKIVIVVLGIIIIALATLLIFTKIQVHTIVIEKQETQKKSYMLQHQLDSLLTEHEKIKKEYGNLTSQLSGKDSIILAKADEIQKLMNSQADYNSIKRKLEYLRGITQGYVSQIDSLYRVNKVLKDENVQITDKFEKEQVKTTELTKDKEQLSEKVSLASTLKAYNIKGIPVRLKSGGKKEEIADKAKKADKIKVTFTLSENLIAASGNKTIYVRIARPDEKILSVSNDSTNEFDYNGKKIQYSVKKDIDYQNKAMEITLYWDKIEGFTPGAYVVSVFTDGYLIGEAQFGLK